MVCGNAGKGVIPVGHMPRATPAVFSQRFSSMLFVMAARATCGASKVGRNQAKRENIGMPSRQRFGARGET